MVKKENDFLAGKCIYQYVNNIYIQINGKKGKKGNDFLAKNAFTSMLKAPDISKIYIHEALLRNAFSLRSKRFLAVQEQRTGNKSQNGPSKRAAKAENPVPRSFFPPKPNANDCDAGYNAFPGQFFHMLPELEDIQVNCGF